jgi:hypothetical protein
VNWTQRVAFVAAAFVGGLIGATLTFYLHR